MREEYDYPITKQIMPCEKNLWAKCRDINSNDRSKDVIYYDPIIGWALMERKDRCGIYTYTVPLVLCADGSVDANDNSIEGYVKSETRPIAEKNID